MKVPGSADSICRRVAKAGVLGGLDLGKWHPSLEGGLLFCATENNTLEEMERLVRALEEK